MMTLRRAQDRGHSNHGWLDSYHSFSFSDYYDPKHMGFSNLRVINEDTVAPAGGFATHGHRDMEIVTYVLAGALEHKDSLGNGSVIRPGDVQRMSAGTGVRHSEYNHSKAEPVHFLQVWLEPNARGVAPGYAQRHFPQQDRRERLRLLVSPDGRDDSIPAHQDGLLYSAVLDAGMVVDHPLAPTRRAYVHVARGSVDVDGESLRHGDAVAIEDQDQVRLRGVDSAEVLLFDLP